MPVCGTRANGNREQRAHVVADYERSRCRESSKVVPVLVKNGASNQVRRPICKGRVKMSQKRPVVESPYVGVREGTVFQKCGAPTYMLEPPASNNE